MKSPLLQATDILEVFHNDNGASFDDPMSIETMSAFLANTADFSDPASSSPPSSEAAESPRRRNGKRPYQRPKKELEYLKKKHDELVVRLQKLQEKLSPEEPVGPWKTRAIEQAQSVQRSLIENTRLKEMLEEQLNAIRAFERVLQKRPKLSDFPANEGLWRHAILGENNREADMEMLMKYQYEQLESVLIREGLYSAFESGEEIRKSYVQSSGNEDTMRINFAGSKTVALNYLAMCDVLWDHKITRVGVGSEVIETLNPELVYVREDLTLPDPKMPLLEARIVIRKYVEVNRLVIVWRTIVEDRLFPHTEGNLIGVREGWYDYYTIPIKIIIRNVITANGENDCMMQMFVSTSTPIFPPALRSIQPAVGTLTELLLKATTENKVKFKSVLREAVAARQRLQLSSESDFKLPLCSLDNCA
ncbi:hypothetical protein THRCLA_00265 [Thraustotheca clavata]|uniref:M96 mating-specific protein family n=1 Tax=Thraustotheca clavata TaxID=74557 RepID=A0A1W0AC59_9STRA|nr:hypothetical protein THRCLA_00265 [Thraustotheca clavata]